jgi:hypothetical protein
VGGAAATAASRTARERTEFESIRQGTTPLIAAFGKAIGVVGYRLGPTRSEEDFARFLAARLATRGSAQTVWHLA